MLIKELRTNYDGPVDWVIGSAHAAATISYSFAQELKAKHDFTEKGPEKTQEWKRHVILPEETVLQVEELITTAGTLEAVRKGIRDNNKEERGNEYEIKFAPVVMTLVHRSDIYEFEGSPILYLIHYDIETWKQDKCPLCKEGSKKVKPKKIWEKLTGE